MNCILFQYSHQPVRKHKWIGYAADSEIWLYLADSVFSGDMPLYIGGSVHLGEPVGDHDLMILLLLTSRHFRANRYDPEHGTEVLGSLYLPHQLSGDPPHERLLISLSWRATMSRVAASRAG